MKARLRRKAGSWAFSWLSGCCSFLFYYSKLELMFCSPHTHPQEQINTGKVWVTVVTCIFSHLHFHTVTSVWLTLKCLKMHSLIQRSLKLILTVKFKNKICGLKVKRAEGQFVVALMSSAPPYIQGVQAAWILVLHVCNYTCYGIRENDSCGLGCHFALVREGPLGKEDKLLLKCSTVKKKN